MRVLLTGANGLLGQHLLSLLSKDPETDVFATGLGTNRNPPGSYDFSTCDLTQGDQVRKLVRKIQPDYLIHAAAKTQVDWCEQNKALCWKSNVDATEYLVEAAGQFNCHFQYISTDFVFNGKKGNYIETDAPDPVNYYGQSKLAAEKVVSSSGMPWSIVRTVLVYGVARDLTRTNIMTWIWKSLQDNKVINVVTDQIRTPTFVEDLAKGSSLILNKKAQGIFHISGKETLTPFEMATWIAKYFGLETQLIKPVNSTTFTQPGVRPKNTGFIIDKATKQLGYRPGSFEECIEYLSVPLKHYQIR